MDDWTTQATLVTDVAAAIAWLDTEAERARHHLPQEGMPRHIHATCMRALLVMGAFHEAVGERFFRTLVAGLGEEIVRHAGEGGR